MTFKSNISILLVGLVGTVVLSSCATDSPESAASVAQSGPVNSLTNAEETEGWRLLFDGSTFEGWRGLGRDSVHTEHWRIEDGAIRKVASGDVPVAPDGQPLQGGDLMTVDTFDDFEFAFEWKVDSAANSGVKYNVSEELSGTRGSKHAALGFEYQVLDDKRHEDGELPSHRTGALYDLIAPNDNKVLKDVGSWNSSRIVFRDSRGEHWLNGEKVVEFDLTSARFDSLLQHSKYSDIEGFADRRTGHIVLQDHKDNVWYRNLKVRELPTP